MMGHREHLKHGDEYDAVSRKWKNVMHWRSGERKAIKKRLSRRVRQEAKEQTVLLPVVSQTG